MSTGNTDKDAIMELTNYRTDIIWFVKVCF